MGNNFFGLNNSAAPSTPTVERPAVQAPSKKFGGKKLYVVVAAVAAIVIILVAVWMVPQGNADVISLGVDYAVGEKLTYAVTMTISLSIANASMSNSTDGTLTVEVLSFDGDTYTLNYTTSSSANGVSVTASNLVELKKSEMVTALALLPVASQQFNSYGNESGPMLTAFFDQTQAKVGDTWSVPIQSEGSVVAEDLKVTFKAIQDLTVEAGTFRVFRIDYSTSIQQNQSSDYSIKIDLSGQSYLEQGTCRQIQNNLQVAMTFQFLGNDANMDATIASKLIQDVKP